MLNITVRRTQNKKPKPDQRALGFGKYFTDHMFIMDYADGRGWYDPRIIPYGPLPLDPSCMVFHYAQEMFEGLKAYRAPDGGTLLFRPDKNIERMNNTNRRLCIPQLDPQDALQAIEAAVREDVDWVPAEPETSLYIRPFIFATDNAIGVHPSHTYKFIIILSPVGAYYPNGIDPVRIGVESEFVRAVRGGMGEAKTGGNYAASLIGQQNAEEKGYVQVLWLDGVERKYIDEVGSMNVFFIIGGKVVTPALEGSILPGVTRASCIDLLRSWGLTVEERRISIDELEAAGRAGKLDEAFGSGTAAVISPIGELAYKGEHTVINNNEIGKISRRLYDTLTGIQWGRLPDTFGWTVKL